MALTVDIKKRFSAFALEASFTAANDTLALLGASGCGKSMTLKCIAGIVKPDSGHIELDGTVLFDSSQHINLPPQKRRVGLLFQHYALFPNMTVEQNILSGASLEKDRSKKAARTRELIAAFRLDGLERHRPHQLSGGQQQRVALARILAGEPRALLLDEPFSALDSYLKWQLEQELMDTLCAFCGPVLYVSHDRNEVRRICDNVCVISDGRTQAVMPVSELFERPATLSAAVLSGCKNFSRAQKTGAHSVMALDWGAELTTSAEVLDSVKYIGVRAHFLRTDGTGNLIPCHVTRVVEDVFSRIIMFEADNGPAGSEYRSIRLETDKSTAAAPAIRESACLCASPDDIMLLY